MSERLGSSKTSVLCKENGLTQPNARPDAYSLHTALSAWAPVVVLWEFKISSDANSLHTMAGQQITCSWHMLDPQPHRTLVVTVCLTMDTLELLWIEYRQLGPYKCRKGHNAAQQAIEASARM